MTEEEKRLLLKDLCARQPYGVKFKAENEDSPIELHYVRDEDVYGRIYSNLPYWIEIIKPYLRPMSSMTKKEFDEYMRFIKHSWEGIDKEEDDYYVKVKDRGVYIDWLNEHHFDYRGLIEKGLALEAPEGMYKF